mgnify:CR=1 FL=1|jgi:hypothetical protein|tara:strand:- start:2244 stop:2474 length:231 start_codon:yes stop_codon:yes gene_type:complete
MTTVTIRYGMTNSITREFEEDSTIGSILADRGILGALNAPEGCVAVASGENLSNDDYVHNSAGTTITLEKQASSKA